MPQKRLNAALLKANHASEIARVVSATGSSEAGALVSLKELRLDGQGLEKIENLDPFDQCEELYLHHNTIGVIQNLDFLRRLRVLSLSHNSITLISGLSHLRSLEVLDLSYNRIELPLLGRGETKSAGGEEAKEDGGCEALAAALPAALAILDLRHNPCTTSAASDGGRRAADQGHAAAAGGGGAAVRRAVVRALAHVRQVDGAVVTLAERRAALASSSGALFEAWCAGPAGRRRHVVYVAIKAEFAHEVDKQVRVSFCDGDDLGSLALDFCRKHGITDVAGGAQALEDEMLGAIDQPLERGRFLLAQGGGGGQPGGARAGPASPPPPPLPAGGREGKEEEEETKRGDLGGDGLAAFTARVAAFYARYDPSKVPNAAAVVAKYGGQGAAGRRKLLAALVQKYGPEPLPTPVPTPPPLDPGRSGPRSGPREAARETGGRDGEAEEGERGLEAAAAGAATAARARLAGIRADLAARRKARRAEREAAADRAAAEMVAQQTTDRSSGGGALGGGLGGMPRASGAAAGAAARLEAELRGGLEKRRAEARTSHARLRAGALARVEAEASVGAP